MATASDGLGIYADDANVDNALVSVTTHVNRYGNGIATVPRDEFLDAVARELDVIIIDRADLPPVEEQNDVLQAGHIFLHRKDRPGRDPGEQARAWLALAEHLEQNPPIDEAQVGALWNLMAQHHDDARNQVDEGYGRALARRLVAAGVRAPEAGDNQ